MGRVVRRRVAAIIDAALRQLYERAQAAAAHAYAPYSGFHVGAALRAQDGTIYTGCNVENASYGLTICAERVALASAIAAGVRSFSEIAVAGPADANVAPCGACRQVLAEFTPGLRVLYQRGPELIETTVALLLPESFTL